MPQPTKVSWSDRDCTTKTSQAGTWCGLKWKDRELQKQEEGSHPHVGKDN